MLLNKEFDLLKRLLRRKRHSKTNSIEPAPTVEKKASSEWYDYTIPDDLEDMFTKADLKLVDIGARGGPMPQFHSFAELCHYFCFEPDDHEAKHLTAELNQTSPWRQATVVPKAIHSTSGETDLNITKQPGLSSLLKPNPEVIRKYYLDDEFDIVSINRVKTLPLDAAAKQYGFNDACFLKIDTQGTELDILRSGSRLLTNNLVGVYSEVEFQPFYEGQPLFSDVDSFLRDSGFTLFDLHRTLLRRVTGPKTQYSRRQVVWAHALYLKEEDALPDNDRYRMTIRLLALALVFEHYDLALQLCTNLDNSLKESIKIFIGEQSQKALARLKNAHGRPESFAFADKDRKYRYR